MLVQALNTCGGGVSAADKILHGGHINVSVIDVIASVTHIMTIRHAKSGRQSAKTR
jgi:hypothetical protein